MAKEKEDCKEAATSRGSEGSRLNIAKDKARVREDSRTATTKALAKATTQAVKTKISGKREARDTEKEDTERSSKM